MSLWHKEKKIETKKPVWLESEKPFVNCPRRMTSNN